MGQKIKTKSIVLTSHSGQNMFKEVMRQIDVDESEVLIKMICFSIDPVMKFWAAGTKTYFKKVEIGDVFNCFGIGLILQGNQIYSKDSYIFGNIGTS